MACLVAPVAAVLIVNRRESKDKIMVRLLLMLSVGWPFAVGGKNIEASLFAEVLTSCFGYDMCFCSYFVTNSSILLPHLPT